MSSDESDLRTKHSEWKKKTPFFYDFIISHSLPFQSLTVDWSSSSPRPHNREPSLALHTLLFASFYMETKSSFLTIADVPLPTNDKPLAITPKVEVTQNIVLDDAIYAARFMPQKPNIVCAKTSSLGLSVYDCTEPQEADHSNPDLILTDHFNLFRHGEFSALAWHPNKEGYILFSDGRTIYLWNVPALYQHKELKPILVHLYHEEFKSMVQDVQWHLKNENLLGSVAQNGELSIWDMHTNNREQFIKTESQLNCLSFHPFNEWLLATASSDTTVDIFDMRKLSKRVCTLKNGHTKEIEKVEWDPNHESVLASSGGEDRKVIIWDINRIGDERLKGDSRDKSPELLFSHVGHTGTVFDFSWNKHDPWVISSVAQDETLQVWKLAQHIR